MRAVVFVYPVLNLVPSFLTAHGVIAVVAVRVTSQGVGAALYLYLMFLLLLVLL